MSQHTLGFVEVLEVIVIAVCIIIIAVMLAALVFDFPPDKVQKSIVLDAGSTQTLTFSREILQSGSPTSKLVQLSLDKLHDDFLVKVSFDHENDLKQITVNTVFLTEEAKIRFGNLTSK